MNGRRTGAGVHVALALVQVLFAANAVFGKIALDAVSPFALLGVRIPSAALVFLAMRELITLRSGRERLRPADLWRAAYCSVLGVSLNQVLYFEGLSRAKVINVAVLAATIPVFTTGFSIALGQERPTARRLGGLAVACAGALVVVLFGRGGSGPVRLSVGLGEVCVIASSTVYALYLVLSRPLFQRYRTDTAITPIFVLAALTVAPFCLLPAAQQVPGASAAVRASILFIVLGPTLAAYFLNGYALRRAPASLVAIYIYCQPLIAAVLAWRLLGEHLTVATAAGGALIFAGIALVSWKVSA